MRITPLLLALAVFGGPAVLSAPADGMASLLRRRLEAPRFAGARWGVQAVSLDSGRILFEQDSGKAFLPASTAKLFSAALALCTLGPDYRIRTSVYGSARPDADGLLAGDLILYGRGDPALLARQGGGTGAPDPLEALADQLQAAGVRAVAGDLVADDSFFDTPPYGPGWEAEDLERPFGAEPSALTVHDNMVDLWVYPGAAEGRPCLVFPMPGFGLLPVANRTATRAGQPGSIRADRPLGQATLRLRGELAPGAQPIHLALSVHDPALLFGQLLRRALERRGIHVRGGVRPLHAEDRAGAPLEPARLAELAHLESPPLAQLVRATLKPSNNLYAQLLLLQAGARRPGRAPGPADTGDGLAALGDFLAGLGIAAGDVRLEDGAGLSRKDLVKPAALVQLLAAMARRPEGPAFLTALPVAGMDGTLAGRMTAGPAYGRLLAKTGTLRDTHTLAGYLTTAGGDHLAFAILLNNAPAPASAGGADLPSPQAEVDAIAGILADNP